MSNEHAVELRAEDWFEVKKRGWTCASFAGIPGFNPRQLKGQKVVIDGNSYRVLAVETFAAPDHVVAGKPFALAVEPEPA